MLIAKFINSFFIDLTFCDYFHKRKKKEPINKIKIPFKYRKGSMNDGINSRYFKRISTKRYWELAPHNKNPKKYPKIIDISELKL